MLRTSSDRDRPASTQPYAQYYANFVPYGNFEQIQWRLICQSRNCQVGLQSSLLSRVRSVYTHDPIVGMELFRSEHGSSWRDYTHAIANARMYLSTPANLLMAIITARAGAACPRAVLIGAGAVVATSGPASARVVCNAE